MPVINCKIYLDLNWIQDCILSPAIFYVPIVTLSTKDNVNLAKQLSNRFKRSVYWSSYQTIPAKIINKGANIYELLRARLQGVRRLFVLTYVIDANAAANEAGIKKIESIFFQEEKLKL